MEHKTSVALFEYWNRQRRDAAVPPRNAIEPAAIRTVLPNVFILEPGVGGHTQFRLAGTAICSLFDRELKGASLTDLWQPGGADHIRDAVDAVIAHRAPALISVYAESRAGRSVDLEIILLPLAGGTGGTDRILGALSPLSLPYWLNSDPLISLVTTAANALNLDEARKIVAARAHGYDEEKTVVFNSRRGEVAGKAGNDRLVLLDGGRQD